MVTRRDKPPTRAQMVRPTARFTTIASWVCAWTVHATVLGGLGPPLRFAANWLCVCSGTLPSEGPTSIRLFVNNISTVSFCTASYTGTWTHIVWGSDLSLTKCGTSSTSRQAEHGEENDTARFVQRGPPLNPSCCTCRASPIVAEPVSANMGPGAWHGQPQQQHATL